MRVTGVLMVYLAAVILTAPAAGQARSSHKLAAVLDEFRDHYAVPGVSAAICFADGSLVTAASGLADIEAGRPLSPDTPMLAASIGKTFVAATVLSLEADGRLSRSDLLMSHLGGRPAVGAAPNADAITLGHLLHHTSGLPDHVHMPQFQRDWAGVAAIGTAFDPEDLLGFVTEADAVFEPGGGWAYSDTGYVLLGLVIEEVTGKPWRSVVETRFLEPLGLSNTLASDRADLPGLAVGYVDPDNAFGLPARTADKQGRLVWNPAVESAGGGFASTAPDLARWGHALFGGTAMEGPYLDRLLDGVEVDPASPGVLYGAGVAIYADTARGPVYGHGGWIPGYVSSLRHYADHRLTIAFQMNTDISAEGGATDLAPALEAALADLALTMKPRGRDSRLKHRLRPGAHRRRRNDHPHSVSAR